tara:strand:+ start:4002 stop:5648 length:1647 start_codon:yes stop_codon:yes gene_type:complete
MSELGEQLSINAQVLTATVSRLMRAGLIELTFEANVGKFRPTALGFGLISSGAEPRVDEETRPRPISAVFLPLTGTIMRTSDVRFVPSKDTRLDSGMLIPLARQLNNREQMDTIYDRLTETVRLRPNEVVRSVDPKSIDIREGYIEIRQETLANLPENEARAVAALVKLRRSGESPRAQPKSERKPLELKAKTIPWNPDDIVIGGSSHKTLFEQIISSATDRVMILSTFIDMENVNQIWSVIEEAAERGVQVDLLFGVAGEDESKHTKRAQALAVRVALSRFSNRIKMHKQSVSTHAKFLVADDGEGGYLAVTGSCNWLSTPFRAVEISVILRHPTLVAQVAAVCRKAFSDTPLSNDLVSFLGTLSRWGDAIVHTAHSSEVEQVTVSILPANEHAGVIRRAAAEARNCLVIGSHRFGSSAEQAMLVAAANAARNVTDMRVIYTQIRKPQFRSDVTALRNEYEPKGVKFVHLDTQKGRTPIHGKFLLWDDDNVVVTSLNWASATVGDEDLTSEIGIHLSGRKVGDAFHRKLQEVVPRIDGEFITNPKKN